jgi:hypothetical protein
MRILKSVKILVTLWIACVSQPLLAQTTIGDWVYQSKVTFYAATVNDSGNVFGQWCDAQDGNCFYILSTPTKCEEGARYPVLINSDTVSLHVTLICKGPLEGSQKYRHFFDNFELIDDLVRKSKRIGIAMPLEGDQFRVFRFTLNGAVNALTSMRASAEKAFKVFDKKSTRDQNL